MVCHRHHKMSTNSPRYEALVISSRIDWDGDVQVVYKLVGQHIIKYIYLHLL